MSEPIKHGGPAFPVEYNPLKLTEHKPSLSSEQCRGMTLRDYFAAKAGEKDISEYSSKYDKDGKYIRTNSRVESRYAFADAMLKAREVKP